MSISPLSYVEKPSIASIFILGGKEYFTLVFGSYINPKMCPQSAGYRLAAVCVCVSERVFLWDIYWIDISLFYKAQSLLVCMEPQLLVDVIFLSLGFRCAITSWYLASLFLLFFSRDMLVSYWMADTFDCNYFQNVSRKKKVFVRGPDIVWFWKAGLPIWVISDVGTVGWKRTNIFLCYIIILFIHRPIVIKQANLCQKPGSLKLE